MVHMRFLLAIDGSRHSYHAAKEAARLLHAGDDITLAFISPLHMSVEYVGPYPGTEGVFLSQDVMRPPTDEDRYVHVLFLFCFVCPFYLLIRS